MRSMQTVGVVQVVDGRQWLRMVVDIGTVLRLRFSTHALLIRAAHQTALSARVIVDQRETCI